MQSLSIHVVSVPTDDVQVKCQGDDVMKNEKRNAFKAKAKQNR